jgi:flagellar basal-body rod protein FlgF
MNEIYALTLASLQNDMARVDNVAANLANSSTPAYKRHVIVSRSFEDAVQEVRSTDPGNLAIDRHIGTVRNTGQALDLMLGGEGYFEVLTQQGPAYMRRGDFGVDAQGRLVTSQGHLVMGKGGEIQLTGRSPEIDAAGRVTERLPGSSTPTAVGQLKVMRFDPEEVPRQVGEGLFAAGAHMSQVEDTDVQLRQGALENSNVQATQEMVELVQTLRHFESMHRAVQGYDEMVGTAIRKFTDS